MIVTLAGHVDHGKTSLVRALTGVDTDRLAEEKARGLTIDLGFAYLSDANLGFVDVPGHHRFIHNMVAGVAEHQFALLVVAADDGPMPQTREHLQILTLLGIRAGVVALTKCDLVSDERADAAQAEVSALVAGTFLADAQIFRCRMDEADGVANLKAELTSTAAQRATPQAAPRQFRMPIDRAFNIRGSGTVVTGTVLAGAVQPDANLTVFPCGKTARVRSVHANDRPAEYAHPGDRTALNLTGIDIQDVQRGAWITSDPTASAHLTLDLEVLADFPRAVKHWTPVHAYHGTTHATGRIAQLTEARLEPGSTNLVDLVLDEPLPARAGDRILLRDQSLDVTLGGGTVRDTQAPNGRRRDSKRMARLNALRTTDPSQAFRRLLELGPVQWPAFRTLWGLPADTPRYDTADVLERSGWLVHAAQWQEWRNAAEQFITRHLKDHPNLQGVRENELPHSIPTGFRSDLLRELAASDKLAQTGGMYHLPRHAAVLTDAQQQLMQTLEPLLNTPQPPSLGDIAKRTALPLNNLSKALPALARLKVLDQINDTRFYLPQVLDELAATAEQLAAEAPFDVRRFRDATGIGRNVAIDVLEHFDRKGFTRRQGNERIVAGKWRAR